MAGAFSFEAEHAFANAGDITNVASKMKFDLVTDVGGGWDELNQFWAVPAGYYEVGFNGVFTGINTVDARLSVSIDTGNGTTAWGGVSVYNRINPGTLIVNFSFKKYLYSADNWSAWASMTAGVATFDGSGSNGSLCRFWGCRIG